MKSLIILLFSCPILLFGQSNIDSLKEVLNTTMKGGNAQEKGKIVLQLSNAYLNEYPAIYDEAIQLLENNLSLLDEEVTRPLIADYYDVLGVAYYVKDNYEASAANGKAVEYFEKAIPLIREEKDTAQLANVLLNTGIMLLYQDKVQSLSYLKEAARLYEYLDNADRLASCYGEMCSIYSSMGDFDQALIYSRQAMNLHDRISDYFTIAQTGLSIANTYMSAQRFEEAEEVLHIALSVSEEADDDYLIAHTKMYLGGNIVSRNNPDKEELQQAKAYLDEAKESLTEQGVEFSLAYINVYFASYYCIVGEYEKAIELIDSYLKYVKAIGNTEALLEGIIQRAIVLQNAQRMEEAKGDFEKAITLAMQTKNKQAISHIYQSLYNLEKQSGNFQAALSNHEQFQLYEDSIYNENLKQILGVESAKINLEGAERARVSAEEKAAVLSFRSRIYLGAAIFLLLILSVIIYLFQQLSKAQKQLKAQNIQLSQLNATKDKFFGLIAHDIRSPIVALDGVGEQMAFYLKKNKEDKLKTLAERVDTTAKRLSSLLDNLLNWALLQTGTIPYNPQSLNLSLLSEEIIALYEPVAIAKNISIDNLITEASVVYADEGAISTVLRNLIHNALKFTPEGGKVTLNAIDQNDKITIEVNDTGTGISAEKLPKLFSIEGKSSKGTAGEKGTGLGLMLCKELITLNKGTIRAISKMGEGAKFIFSIPKVN